MSSPREREKRNRRESGGDEREGHERKRKMNESEETEEIKKKRSPSTLTCFKDSRSCPALSQPRLDPFVAGFCLKKSKQEVKKMSALSTLI